MKKLVTVCLTVVAALSLAACSGQSKNSTSKNDSSKSSKQSSSAKESSKTLTYGDVLPNSHEYGEVSSVLSKLYSNKNLNINDMTLDEMKANFDGLKFKPTSIKHSEGVFLMEWVSKKNKDITLMKVDARGYATLELPGADEGYTAASFNASKLKTGTIVGELDTSSASNFSASIMIQMGVLPATSIFASYGWKYSYPGITKGTSFTASSNNGVVSFSYDGDSPEPKSGTSVHGQTVQGSTMSLVDAINELGRPASYSLVLKGGVLTTYASWNLETQYNFQLQKTGNGPWVNSDDVPEE